MQVVGIDPSIERLEVAREKYSASNIEYKEGTAESIPETSGIDSYDYIFSNFVLHWCKNKDQVFKEIYRVLKKGGKFGFMTGTPTCTDPAGGWIPAPSVVSSEFLAAAHGRLHKISMDEYTKLASTHKLEIVHTEEMNHKWKFSNVHEYFDSLQMHMHGDFDSSHFNVVAAKRHFGEGELTIVMPFATIVVVK